MKIKPNRDFEIFKREFTKWQTRFGLNGYSVHFEHKPLEGQLACISTQQNTMCTTVTLGSNRIKNQDACPPVTVPELAKHEAIHLLIHRVQSYGEARYLGSEEMGEAIEELTIRLERLIE